VYFEAWHEWHKWGAYPSPGGRNGQPLKLLSYIRAIDLTYDTFMYRNGKDHKGDPLDLSKLTPTQLELMIWLDNDE